MLRFINLVVLLGLLFQNVVPLFALRPLHASAQVISTDVAQPASDVPGDSRTQQLVPTASPQRTVAATKTSITGTVTPTVVVSPTQIATATPAAGESDTQARDETLPPTPELEDGGVLINPWEQTYLPVIANGTPSPEEEVWEGEIDEDGGSVDAFDGELQVEFPAGAVTETVRVTVQTPDGDNRPPYFLGGRPFEIEAESLADRQVVETFSADVTIRVAYNPQRIEGVESHLSLFYYDEELGSWVPLPTEVDTSASRLTARTTHFTNFDVKAQEWEAATLPSVKSSQVQSFTGAGTYSYPIQVPDGPGGLQPSVQLSYNSQVVDRAHNRTQASWVGMGWSLNTGYIKRDTRGSYDELDDDVFTLNVNGVSSVLLPADDGTYHTADERFWRIEYDGGDPNDFDAQDGTWTIWDKQGNTYELGANASERASFPVFFSCDEDRDDHKYVTWQWSLSRKTNKFGKSLRYTYHHETKNFHNVCGYSNRPGDIAVYPDAITYPHDRYRVKFERAADRTDYDNAWETGYYFTSFKRSRLTSIRVQHNADGDSTFEETIRRYELTYASDAQERVFPHVEWSAGGDTLTLVGIQEFGLNDSATLPATSFTYGDDMHLTDVHNGYGGRVHLEYEPWHSTEWNREQHRLQGHYRFGEFCHSIDDDWETVTGRMVCELDRNSDDELYTWLELFSEQNAPAEIETNFGHQYSPGTVYKITGDFKRFTPGTWAQVGIEGVESPQVQIGAGDHTRVSVETQLDGAGGDPHLVIRCSDRCKVWDLELVALPTHYRVVEKRIIDDVTDTSHTFRYRYDEPAMNDEAHSAGAGTDHPYTKANTEFRGHALVQEIGPDGRVTSNWFRQSDALSGRSVRNQVGTQSFWDAFDNRDTDAWQFTPADRHTIERLAGDAALKATNADNRWDTTHLARSSYSLNDGDIVQLQFRAGDADTESRLAVESPDGEHWGIWLTPTDAGTPRIDLWRSGDTGETLIPANQFKIDAWYVLQLGVDDQQFLLRLWQRDGGTVHRVQTAMPAGKHWRFHQWTRSGTLWLDTYSEGTLLSETETGYAVASDDDASDNAGYTVAIDTDRLPTCDDEPCSDLNIRWVRSTYKKQLTFEQDAEFVGRLTEFQYRPADQQGQQYGNQTRVIEKRLDGDTFVPYRATWQQFYPAVTDETYLVGLPGYGNTYACPDGTCDFSLETLERSTQHLYDGNRAYDARPERGLRTGTRTFVCFVGQDGECGEYRENAPVRFQDASFAYDAWGNTVEQVQYRNYGTADSFAGDMPAEQQDALATTTTYDSDYHTYKVVQTNAEGHSTHWHYDGVGFTFGVPTRKLDANNNPTTAEYDEFGRLTEIRRPYDEEGSGRATVAIDYHDEAPFWTAVHQKRTEEIVQTVRKFYDGLGQLIQLQTADVLLDDGTRADVAIDTAYDAYGNKTRVTVPYTPTPPSSGWRGQHLERSATTTTYDPFGRPVAVVTPDGSRQTHSYDDLIRTVTDPKQRTARTETDIFGRTTRIVPPTGPTLEYTHDVLDQLVEVTKVATDSQELTTSIAYDAAGRKLAMDDPDMGTWSYTYDAAGNLLSQTDARGIVTHFRYDKLNRLLEKWHTATASAESEMVLVPEPVRHFYDEGGSDAEANGQRTRMVDSAGTTTWQYDKRGRVTNKTRVIDDVGTYELGYTYDSADDVIGVIYPDGEVVTTIYDDGRGLPADLSSSLGNTFVSDAGYDAQNRTRRLMLGNGIETIYDYYAPDEQGGRLHTLRTSDNSLNLAYRYDAVGNIDEIIDRSISVGNQRLAFEYDALDRLTQARTIGGEIPGYDIDYRYDSLGRLDQRHEFTRTLGYSYSAEHPHAAVTFDDNSYAYDAVGNMTERVEDGITYTQYWTPDNKLARVTWTQDGRPYTTTFAYDGDGSRLLKIEEIEATQGPAEVTTAYIDGIYEERLDTAAVGLNERIYVGNNQQTEEYRTDVDSAQSRAQRAPGLQAPPRAQECPGDLVDPDTCLVISETGGAGDGEWQSSVQDPAFQWTWWEEGRPDTVAYYEVSWESSDGTIDNFTTTSTSYNPPPPAVEGTSTLQVIARDANGDSELYWSHTFQFQYDATDPSDPASAVEANGAESGTWQNTVDSPNFDWPDASDAVSGIAEYEYYWGTASGGSPTQSTFASNYNAPAVDSSGTYYLRARSVDHAGNTSAVRTLFVFRYDGTPPTLTNSAEETNGATDGEWQNNVDDPAFTWDPSTDAHNDVDGYYVYWGQSATGTATTWATSPNFDPGPVSDGTYYLRVQAVDSLGNKSAWKTLYTFRYDGTAPSTPSNAQEAGGTSSGEWQNIVQDPSFTWFAVSDAVSGVAGYDVYWGADPGGTDAVAQPTTASYNPTAVSSGDVYYLRVRTRDNAGNTSNWVTLFTFKYDGVDPEPPNDAIELNGVTDAVWQNGVSAPHFSWSGASDEHSDVVRYHVYFGPDSIGTAATTVGTAEYVPPEVTSDGTYYLRVRAEDDAGNSSSWATLYTFKYDSTPPTNPNVTEINGAQDEVWQNATNEPAFVWSGAADSASGVAGYRWYWGSDTEGTSTGRLQDTTAFTPTTAVSSGATMYLRMQTEDEAGNRSPWETLFTFKYDGDAPAISNVAPANGTVITETQPHISADLSDLEPGSGIAPAETMLIVDGDVVTPQQTTAAYVEYVPSQPLDAGQHFATLRIEDRAGNSADSNWSFTVDPTTWVEITAPADGIVINNRHVPLSLELESQAGIRVTVTTPVTTVTHVVNTGYWQSDRLPLQTGTNVVTVDVQDAAGNTATDITTVTVDPAAHTALISAGSDVVNPTIDDVRFDVTARAGSDYDVSGWNAEIRASDGTAVATFTGDSSADGEVVLWDGRNGAGNIVADGTYTYTLAVEVTDGATTETATSLPENLHVRTTPPETPTLRCDSNPLWFSVPPALLKGSAPQMSERVIVSLDGEQAIVTDDVSDDGSWQAPLPLADAELRTASVTAIDAAGNESAPSPDCEIGLSLSEPFTLPHASLSHTYVGLDTSVALTATTRTTGGAPADAVWATLPPSEQTLTMTEQVAGTWTGTWRTAASGAFEGVGVVQFDATDVAVPVPNHGTQFVQPYLDMVAPETRLREPVDEQRYASDSVQVAGRTEPLSTIIVRAERAEDGLVVTDSVASTALGRWHTTLALDDGEYSITAHAVDRAGNVGAPTEAVTILVDTTAPSIGPLDVQSRYVQPNSNIVLTTTVTDTLSGVDRVQALVADLPSAGYEKLLHLIADDGNAYRSGLNVSADTTEGQKPVTLHARDRAGNDTERADGALVIDGTPPVVADPVFGLDDTAENVYLAEPNLLYYGPASTGEVEVEVEARDNAAHTTSGIASVTFPSLFADDDGATRAVGGATAPATYTHRYPVEAAQSVSTSGTVRVEDRAGNANESSAVHVTYDDRPPAFQGMTLALSDDATQVALDEDAHTVYYGEAAAGELTVAVTTEDAGAGVDTVVFPDIFDGGTEYALSAARNPQRITHTYAVDSFSRGAVHVTATDAVGNVSASPPFTLVQDVDAPTVAVTGTAASSTDIVVSWAGVDDASGLAHYDVQYRDGDADWVPWHTDVISTSAEFIGIPDHAYTFRVRATDSVGNTGAWHTTDLIAEASTVTKYYTLGDRRVAMRRGDEVTYFQGDHLRSVSLATDEAGAVVNEVRYTPFGQERWRALPTAQHPSGASSGRITDFGYTGQRLEVGFGLMDYNARYYDPVLGRFISPDTIVPEPGKSQSFDRYAYVENNSVKHTDSAGHWAETALDLFSLGMTLNDIRQNGLNAENGLALVADGASLVLPLVGGGGMLVRAATKVDDVADAARSAAHATEAADAVSDAGRVSSNLYQASEATPTLARFKSITEEVIPEIIDDIGDAVSRADEIPSVFSDRRVTTIGKNTDTKVARELDERILYFDDPTNWSEEINYQWINEAIENGDVFYLASPVKKSTLKGDSDFGGISVYARELDALLQAGYRRVGDHMVPPN